jgi:nicotinamide riboside kinase
VIETERGGVASPRKAYHIMPTVINLFAGPSSGKSTMAFGLSYRLKCLRVNVEFAGEYAKDLVWSKRHRDLEDQVYVFGKQQQRIQRLAKDCDVIVADSPVLMGLAYAQDYPLCFRQTVAWRFHQFDNINFFVNRVTEYDPIGRNQTEEEAQEKDREIFDLLDEFEVPFVRVDGNEAGLEDALNIVLERIGK